MLCSRCHGSGEGLYEGSRCSACKGKGENEDEDEEPKSKCQCCGNPSEDSICSSCEDDGYWMDPIGTIHHRDDDPLKKYE